MKLQQIKDALAQGKNVYWRHTRYAVTCHGGSYVIRDRSNQNSVGLTWADGATLNGEEEDFFSSGDWLASFELAGGKSVHVSAPTQDEAIRRMEAKLNETQRYSFQALWDQAGEKGFRFTTLDNDGCTAIELRQVD